MKLIVGLGNPGPDYRDTYHNMGFKVAEKLASRLCAPDFAFDKKSNAMLSEIRTGSGEKVLLCLPQTYMNLSGDAVSFLVRYYKIAAADVLVAYDDIDIAKGTVRARLSGSAGTHNGMRDIVGKIGDGFARVRVGIGFRPNYMALADYVLSHVSVTERATLDAAISAAADFAEDWMMGKTWQDLTVTVN